MLLFAPSILFIRISLLKTKFLFSTVIISALCFQSVNATTMPKPEQCPSVASLKAVGIQLNEVFETYIGRWETRTVNKFNTNNYWYFDIARIHANDQNEAHQKANDTLSTMILTSGEPKWYPPPVDHWMCEYFAWPLYIVIRVMAETGPPPA